MGEDEGDDDDDDFIEDEADVDEEEVDEPKLTGVACFQSKFIYVALFSHASKALPWKRLFSLLGY